MSPLATLTLRLIFEAGWPGCTHHCLWLCLTMGTRGGWCQGLGPFLLCRSFCDPGGPVATGNGACSGATWTFSPELSPLSRGSPRILRVSDDSGGSSVEFWETVDVGREVLAFSLSLSLNFYFFSGTCGIRKFPGQASSPSRSCNLCYSNGHARSLTHCATVGTPLLPF